MRVKIVFVCFIFVILFFRIVFGVEEVFSIYEWVNEFNLDSLGLVGIFKICWGFYKVISFIICLY